MHIVNLLLYRKLQISALYKILRLVIYCAEYCASFHGCMESYNSTGSYIWGILHHLFHETLKCYNYYRLINLTYRGTLRNNIISSKHFFGKRPSKVNTFRFFIFNIIIVIQPFWLNPYG